MKFAAADIAEQTRQMGRADWLAGVTECPFGPKSRAARHWWQGWNEAARFPLFAILREAA